MPQKKSLVAGTDKSVTLKWDAFGTEITKLALQYAILNGKNTFTDLKKNGGREITLSNPQVTGEYVVTNSCDSHLHIAWSVVVVCCSVDKRGALACLEL